MPGLVRNLVTLKGIPPPDHHSPGGRGAGILSKFSLGSAYILKCEVTWSKYVFCNLRNAPERKEMLHVGLEPSRASRLGRRSPLRVHMSPLRFHKSPLRVDRLQCSAVQ